jgi:anti-sigma factor ChrR (cupin superfamily)
MTAETPNYAPHVGLGALASRYVSVADLEWTPTGSEGVDWKILFRDKARGLMTALVRFQPGSRIELHEHVDIEQSYLLEGALEDAEGVCRAGDFVWRPIGNRHVAASPQGALLVAIFQTPNLYLEGPLAGQSLEPRETTGA